MMSELDPFLQIRTTRGQVPCRSVLPIADGADASELDPKLWQAFRFEPVSVDEARAAAAAEGGSAPAKGITLLALSECVRPKQPEQDAAASDAPSAGDQADAEADPAPFAQVVHGEDLYRFACAHGPLFGAAAEERVNVWASAAIVAELATRLQQVASKLENTMSVAALNGGAFGNIAKYRLANPATGTHFSLIVISRAVDAEYARHLEAPFVRREEREGRINYAFLSVKDEGMGSNVMLYLHVVSLEHEMSLPDYLALSRAFDFDTQVDDQARRHLFPEVSRDDFAGAQDPAAYGLAQDALHTMEEVPFDDADCSPIASLVRLLVAAHLQEARLDVFFADEKTGHLRFPNYLAWLWYEYSGSIEKVRIGYCGNCGKPFSLVGHRGRERLFCSEKCKNEAKNRLKSMRTAQMREEFQGDEEFNGGRSVAEIARAFQLESQTYESALDEVRRALNAWPVLKKKLDVVIPAQGWDAELFARCMRDGLDWKKILHKPLQEELLRNKDDIARVLKARLR